MNNFFIEILINNLSLDNLFNLFIKNNIEVSKEEVEILYPIVKNRYPDFFNLEKRADLEKEIKESTSEDFFNKSLILLDKLKNGKLF